MGILRKSNFQPRVAYRGGGQRSNKGAGVLEVAPGGTQAAGRVQPRVCPFSRTSSAPRLRRMSSGPCPDTAGAGAYRKRAGMEQTALARRRAVQRAKLCRAGFGRRLDRRGRGAGAWSAGGQILRDGISGRGGKNAGASLGARAGGYQERSGREGPGGQDGSMKCSGGANDRAGWQYRRVRRGGRPPASWQVEGP